MAEHDSMDLPSCGRKGKTCSMTGCNNSHLRCPNMSFFRFPKETIRSREWLDICQRPDLIERMDAKEININNYYVCEIHFPSQILDYSTRKILVKTAKPLSLAQLKRLPPHVRFAKAKLPMRIPKRRQTINHSYRRNEIADETADNDEDTFTELIVPKVEVDHDNNDLLEPLHMQDDDTFGDDASRLSRWTVEATRELIRLRVDRDSEFEMPNARKTQLWSDICNEMQRAGYDFTVDKVSKKWYNMTITYHINSERSNSRINWEFYDEMDAFFRGKKSAELTVDEQSVQPPASKQRKVTNTSPVMQRDVRRQPDHSTPIRDSEAGPSTRSSTRETRRTQPANEVCHEETEMSCDPMVTSIKNTPAMDEAWWKNYFEKKLELEREKMNKDEERHKDRMNFQKMALMLQERVEKVKIEAVNNLTKALQRLQESSRR